MAYGEAANILCHQEVRVSSSLASIISTLERLSPPSLTWDRYLTMSLNVCCLLGATLVVTATAISLSRSKSKLPKIRIHPGRFSLEVGLKRNNFATKGRRLIEQTYQKVCSIRLRW